MTRQTLRPGDYRRRLIRARTFMVEAVERAMERSQEADRGKALAYAELDRLDNEIRAIDGPKGAA